MPFAMISGDSDQQAYAQEGFPLCDGLWRSVGGLQLCLVLWSHISSQTPDPCAAEVEWGCRDNVAGWDA